MTRTLFSCITQEKDDSFGWHWWPCINDTLESFRWLSFHLILQVIQIWEEPTVKVVTIPCWPRHQWFTDLVKILSQTAWITLPGEIYHGLVLHLCGQTSTPCVEVKSQVLFEVSYVKAEMFTLLLAKRANTESTIPYGVFSSNGAWKKGLLWGLYWNSFNVGWKRDCAPVKF